MADSLNWGRMFQVRSAWGALVAFSISQAVAAEPSQLIESPAYWRAFQWDDAGTSTFWTAAGWRDYQGQMQDGEVTWLKQQETAAFGYDGKALLSRNIVREIDRAHFQFDASMAECREFFDRVSARFGKPVESDGSWTTAFSTNNYVKAIFLSYQWDLGPTRITGGCMGSANDEDDRNHTEELFGSLMFTHKSAQKQLVPDIILRCSRAVRFSDDRGGGPEEDIVLRVNLSSSMATNAAGGRLDASGVEVNDSYFAFEQRGVAEGMTSSWRIDRIAGTLRVDMSMDGRETARVTGTCEKLEKIEAKF